MNADIEKRLKGFDNTIADDDFGTFQDELALAESDIEEERLDQYLIGILENAKIKLVDP